MILIATTIDALPAAAGGVMLIVWATLIICGFIMGLLSFIFPLVVWAKLNRIIDLLTEKR
jgi:hypothetical protein